MANSCPDPTNAAPPPYCGCSQLSLLILQGAQFSITDMSYYTCLQSVLGPLVLNMLPDLTSLNGFQVSEHPHQWLHFQSVTTGLHDIGYSIYITLLDISDLRERIAYDTARPSGLTGCPATVTIEGPLGSKPIYGMFQQTIYSRHPLFHKWSKWSK